jgi:hypothetical protein
MALSALKVVRFDLWQVLRDDGLEANRNRQTRDLASLMAILASSRGGVWAGTMAKDQAAEAQAFRAVYYAAVSPWRDADAAMRKAFQD